MAGYAVVTTTQVMKAEALPHRKQIHTHGAIWKERGLLSAQGSPIKHKEEILQLLQDIQQPKEVVVMRCKAHQFGQTVVNVGNRLADKTPREAAEQSILALVPVKQVKLPTPKPNYGKLDRLLAEQLRAVENGDGWWVTSTRQVIVTPQIMIKIAEEKLRETHGGIEAMIVALQKSRLLGTDLIIAGLCVVSDAGESELKIMEELKEVPWELWSKSGTDVGLLKSAQPVHIKTKGGSPPMVKQYPIPQEAERSIQKQIDQYLVKGILRECESLKKDGDPEFRFVQDLRAINQYVIVPHPVVPDPSTVLLQIPYWAKCFTVIDLTAAFFSILIDEESQPLFAFTWKGQQLTWTHLPRGFTGSPTIFSQILKEDLKDIELPGGSVLVQYVDDLLIASKNYDD
ncbi:hypothetical protein QYF61_024295 [Mycteria americana]|uniref:ribonuclease H n=1 Tax=Mycteria americana TaxID=33587 RepID=A0AAN7N305_MYCAM|nr:hypothetical protein QYF61_024295 [Mycteria americana]